MSIIDKVNENFRMSIIDKVGCTARRLCLRGIKVQGTLAIYSLAVKKEIAAHFLNVRQYGLQPLVCLTRVDEFEGGSWQTIIA